VQIRPCGTTVAECHNCRSWRLLGKGGSGGGPGAEEAWGGIRGPLGGGAAAGPAVRGFLVHYGFLLPVWVSA
jgi:hypothetical protein